MWEWKLISSSADLMACANTRNTSISCILTYWNRPMQKKKNGFEKILLFLGNKWVFTCPLYYWPQNFAQVLWRLKHLHCFMFVSLFVLPLSEDWLSPYLRGFLSHLPVFVESGNNISCDIKGSHIKISKSMYLQNRVYIMQCNFTL